MKHLKLYFSSGKPEAYVTVSDNFNLGDKNDLQLDKYILMVRGADGVTRYYNWNAVRMFKLVNHK